MFDVMLAGVGGEGVLTAGVIIARAANKQGLFVRGLQLHGLAQRGGTTPTFVRIGSEEELFSPCITQAGAGVVLAFEPLEAVRACYYADKQKTRFVINEFAYMPVYANLLNVPYPSMNEIKKRVEPFAKKMFVLNATEAAKKAFGKPVLGNTVMLGFASSAGLLPLKKKYLVEALLESAPRDADENLKAFELGKTIQTNYLARP